MERLVRDPEATAITGLGKTQRHELAKQGLFPIKVQISTRASGYRLSELEAWMAARPRAASDLGAELAAAKKAKRANSPRAA